MNRTGTISTTLAAVLAAGLLACSPDGNEAVEKAQEEFKKTTEERMEALQDRMNELKGEIEEPERSQVEGRIEAWEQEFEALENKVQTAKVATLEQLQELERDVNEALNDLRANFEALSRDLRASIR
jgi:TolA-binding protein